MAQNVYEGLFIFDSNRYSRDPGGVSAQIAESVKKLEGEVLVSRLWEERRLAYPINGQRKGTYWLSYFRMDGKHLTTLERECQLSESIMRSLVIKIDPRIVDHLVTHATTVHPTAAPSDPSKAKKPEAKDAPAEAEAPPVEEGGEVG
ncbi:MAG TPA: 30S ribosomal protein S6 [Pirellulales bacterium]|nr:30S ribosomal protein S6 [Pirellulales bacterium]